MIDIQTFHLFCRIVVAGALGAFLGAERRFHGQDAGVRTGSMIAAGSCLFTVLSTTSFGSAETVDVTRIASQVVTGVGFLGAGTVLKMENRVRGLTTAANIWFTAAIGMTIGVGNYLLGLLVTLFALFALIVLQPISEWLRKSSLDDKFADCISDES